jgi:hypothetical protein
MGVERRAGLVPALYQQGVLNRFAFELNNPIGYIDPTGNIPSWASVLLGVAIGVAGVASVSSPLRLRAARQRPPCSAHWEQLR